MFRAIPPNPTDMIDLDFAAFVATRRSEHAVHLADGVPDYSFALDRELRRHLSSMQPLRFLLGIVVRSVEPIQQQLNLMRAIRVGPKQYPRIHLIAEECACRLGIGTPRIFLQGGEFLNAWTFATDDVHPSIVLTTRIVQALDEDEITAIIGHECGHIHNLHGAYATLIALLANPAARGLLSCIIGGSLLALFTKCLTAGLLLFMLRWSRCAEVTCDRAAVICAGGVDPLVSALSKMEVGGQAGLEGFNVDEYVKQIAEVKATPVRLVELFDTHPISAKRIEASRLFGASNVLLSWRPELVTDTPPRPLAEIDALCEDLIGVWSRQHTVDML